MQTFLPVPDFVESARMLDTKRLGKQRVEAYQLLKALADPECAWSNHPASRMWVGYAPALQAYMGECIREWIRRGYHNTMVIPLVRKGYQLPPWFGMDAFHSSHRSALMYKEPEHYMQFGWTDPIELSYIWPIPMEIPSTLPAL